MSLCMKERQGDEFFCSSCDMRWGTDEQGPICKGWSDEVKDYAEKTIPEVKLNCQGKATVVTSKAKPVFDKDEALCLIGVLTAKLACHEPGSETVKNAINYLERQTT